MRKTISSFFVIATLCLSAMAIASESRDMEKVQALNTRQQSIITIAAFTASGDLEKLESALNTGLDAGLTINEIKEILVQMYAYTGFPRSLNGLSTFMTVLDKRKAKGVEDVVGKEADTIPDSFDRNKYGATVRAKLSGLDKDISGTKWQQFSPVIDRFLKEHLFADIFVRGVLSHQDRELATIGALANMSGIEGQLQFHFGAAMNTGLTETQMKEFISVLKTSVGKLQAENAQAVLNKVLLGRKHNLIFDKGVLNPYSKYFHGTSYLNMLSLEGVVMGNVTFEPGCINNWHIHKAEKGGGQILLVTGGRGWYQEAGKEARELHAGDVVHIPAGVKHWHGAAKDSWFVHISVEVPGDNTSNEWLEPVSRDDYNKLP